MQNRSVVAPSPGASVLRQGPHLVPPVGQADRKLLVGFVIFLIASQLALVFLDQLALIIGGTGPLRMVMRIATFSASLVMLLITTRGRERHPSAGPAAVVLIIVVIAIFHPTTNSVFSGIAQTMLYLAILAPIFWVPRLKIDGSAFRRVVLILWGFHTISAALGVAQVYLPGIIQPNLSPVIAAQGDAYVESLRMTTARGVSVFRPMGLTDIPGGAAMSGFFALLFGIGLLLTTRRNWVRPLCILSMIFGMGSIYLSQVRSVLIMAVISVLTVAIVLALRGHVARFGILAIVATAVVVGSFLLAVAVGGESVTNRLATLVSDDPTEVFHSNRGRFLEETIDEYLPRYPVGAGLGRWGMINNYFGDNTDPERESIWVEIQWTGWLLDGGIPLILAYVVALGAAFMAAWRITGRKGESTGDDLYLWSALIVGYNAGALALTFTYPLFIGQSGLEFWLLNAALFAAARASRASRRPAEAS